MISIGDRFDILIRLVCGIFIALGCFFVVQPFMTAILLAAIVTVVTWPIYKRFENSLGNRPTLASIVMVTFLVVCLIIPLTLLSVTVAQQLPGAILAITSHLKSFTIPTWIQDIPFLGPWLFSQIIDIFEPKAMAETLEKLINPLSRQVVNVALAIGNGAVQLGLVAFIAFFFYKDGNFIANKAMQLLQRVTGGLGDEFAGILVGTTRSVVYGILGTALGQALVALIGFLIVDAPATLLLSCSVFVLSVVPIGPPLVWGAVAVWLYGQGEPGLAVFMVLWGTFAISSVDNFLKPILIARGTPLPIPLVFLGVFGGVIAYGMLGLILGPVLLAVGFALFKAWISQSNRKRIARQMARFTQGGSERKHEHADRTAPTEKTENRQDKNSFSR